MGLCGFLRQHFNYGRGAHFYHQLSRARKEAAQRREPWSFYINLVKFPLKRDARIVRLVLLMMVTQVANALGYFYAKFKNRRGPHR